MPTGPKWKKTVGTRQSLDTLPERDCLACQRTLPEDMFTPHGGRPRKNGQPRRALICDDCRPGPIEIRHLACRISHREYSRRERYPWYQS